MWKDAGVTVKKAFPTFLHPVLALRGPLTTLADEGKKRVTVAPAGRAMHSALPLLPRAVPAVWEKGEEKNSEGGHSDRPRTVSPSNLDARLTGNMQRKPGDCLVFPHRQCLYPPQPAGEN